MKNKKRIYDRQELLDQVNKDHSCIILKHCNRKIELQAKYLKDVKAGIKEALDAGLNKFDYSLNGFLLDYRNLNVLIDEWSGRIVGRFGEFLVTVNADFFIFNPQIGSLLEGVVNAKSDTHVGCLVHKCFNAMILKPDVEDKWNCENIQIGDKIIFTIVDHVFSTNIPHIEGVLANKYLEKSSKTSKKKLKVLGNPTQDLSENGKHSDEWDALAENNKKSNKLGDVSSSCVEKQGENNLADVCEDKPQKSKSKKRKIDLMDTVVNDMMDVEESPFEVKKKKKKKEKDKDNTILETEKSLETSNASSEPLENSESVFREPIVPENEVFQVKHKKKKRDRERELDTSESSTERIKKKKKDKRKDSESNESFIVEAAEKKHLGNPEEIEESVPKAKKNKKREKECPPSDVAKTAGQCELSESNKNRLCVDDNAEINVNPIDLIDQLLNVVPTDLILRSETTPDKVTSLEKGKSPKSSSFRKSETPVKNRTPTKKRESGIVTTIGTHIDGFSSKKRNLEDSLKSPKSVKPLDKSLFSDSETSAQSPLKPIPEPVVLDVSSSRWKLGGESGRGEAPALLIENVSSEPNDVSKKEKKPKKGENLLNPEESKSKTVIKDVHSESNEKKSSLNKKEKKDAENKTVSWECENLPTSTADPKSTLLQRFEKCLGNDGVDIITAFANTSKTTIVKNDGDKAPTKMKEKKSSAAKEKAKKAKNKEENSLDDNIRVGINQGNPKVSSLDVDVTLMGNPVTTSTPKTAGSSSDKYGGKSKKPKTKKDKKSSEDVTEAERAAMINALLEQAKESLGIGHLFPDSTNKFNSSI